MNLLNDVKWNVLQLAVMDTANVKREMYWL